MAFGVRIIPRYSPFIWGSVVSAVVLSAGGMQGKDVEDGGTITRPEFAGRVARAFDFEEMYTNSLPVPKGWIRAQHDPEVPRDRPGFPIWNRASLDYGSPAYSGRGTVRLPTEGGSTSLILRHGELTVFPKADYMISARVRTQGLLHARARMVAKVVNRSGELIEGSEVSTRLVRTRGEWDLLSLSIEGTFPDAAFVRVELQLLQPEQQPRERPVKPFTVWAQDFEGGAWFDDVVVAQVPMISLRTGTAGNVVAGDESPVLKMSVRDLTGDDLSSYIRVFDASGMLVDERGSGGGAGIERLGEDWRPELPGYGWYHAVFDVLSGSGLVGREELDFIWQPSSERGELVGGFGAKRLEPENSSFSLRTTSMSPRLLEAFPALAGMIGVKHAEMRVWDMYSESEDLKKGSALLDAIDGTIEQGINVSFTLSEVPMVLADQAAINHDAIFGLLLEHEPIAMPVLGPFMDRYGQQVSDWRLGMGVTEDEGGKLATEIKSISEMMDPYVPGTVIGVLWPMDRPFEGSVLGSPMRLMVEDDPSYPDDAISNVIDSWGQSGGDDGQPASRLSVIYRAHPGDEGGGDESVWSRVGWFGRRAINAWWASKMASPGNDEIEIVLSDPWTIEKGSRGRVMPGPELLVWRTLVEYLGGRSSIQEIDLEPGVRMLLCSGEDLSGDTSDGALVVWLDEASLEDVMIELPLSMGAVEVVDLFGNSTEVGLSYETDLSLPMHRIGVSRTPMIITGVNAELVQFLSNIRLTPDFLEATSGIHKHELVVQNPWESSIRGRVYLVEPGGYSEPGSSIVDRSWDIQPRVMNFSVTGGLEEHFDIDVSYSAAKLAGMKKLVFDVELIADQDYGLMRVEREIELGTDLIELELAFRQIDDGSGKDLVEVVAQVTNMTPDQMSVDLVAIAPKNPRRESTISVVEPMLGGTRTFVFEGLDSGDEVVISVRVAGQTIQLNKSVTMP